MDGSLYGYDFYQNSNKYGASTTIYSLTCEELTKAGLFAIITADTEWMTYAWPCLVGLGLGVTTTLPNVLISLSVPNKLM